MPAPRIPNAADIGDTMNECSEVEVTLSDFQNQVIKINIVPAWLCASRHTL